jgi:hypothetical protein
LRSCDGVARFETTELGMDMAFFLIGRGPEDDLRLLSGEFFATRQDAMAKLSSLSGDASFDQWDSEVFVMDLEVGVPVLLVRPQGSHPAEAPVTTDAPAEDTGDAAAWEADLPDVEAEAAPAEAEVADEAAQAAAVGEADEVPAQTAEEAATDTAEEPVAASEETEAPEGDSADSGGLEGDDLRDAILRTTRQMTAEGIVPPESAGLSSEDELQGDAGEPQGADEDVVAETAPEGQEPEEAVPAQAEAEELPVDAETTTPDEDAQTGATIEDAEGAPVWPWAAPTEALSEEEPVISPDIADVYEALEEPQGTMIDLDALDSEEAGAVGSTETHEPMSSSVDTDEAPGEAGSDFILDLDAIQPVALEDTETAESAPAPSESPQSPASDEEPYSSLTDYTCEDCVYVETCPNRDQRAPKDCGSFQWK